MPDVEVNVEEAETPDVVIVNTDSDNDDATEAVVVEETIDHAERLAHLEDAVTGLALIVSNHDEAIALLSATDAVQQEEIEIMATEEETEAEAQEETPEPVEETRTDPPKEEVKADEPPTQREHAFFRKWGRNRG